MDVKEAAAVFWAEFNEGVQGGILLTHTCIHIHIHININININISIRISINGSVHLKSSIPSTPQAPEEVLLGLRKRLTQLEKRLTDATIYLPSYDQRQCALQISELQSLLNAATKPKPKFSFASKKKDAARASSTLSAQTPKVDSVQSDVALAAGVSEGVDKKDGEVKLEIPPHATVVKDLRKGKVTLGDVLSADNKEDKKDWDVYIVNCSNAFIDLTDLNKSTATTTSAEENSPNNDNNQPTLSAIHIRNLTASLLITPPLAGSVLIDSCNDCTLVFTSCQQYRMHNSVNTRVVLFIPSAPIIEDCTGVYFAPITNECLEFLKSSEKVDEKRVNRWRDVEDFKWLRKQKSPNWGEDAEGGVKWVKEAMDRHGKV
ncbi:hypothetical protein HDV05_002202 [Chytridiales sp. JEL 0842]|nr:hypothetical protein HDV05_002202 [Chytridiales sp. JEL 0842]